MKDLISTLGFACLLLFAIQASAEETEAAETSSRHDRLEKLYEKVVASEPNARPTDVSLSAEEQQKRYEEMERVRKELNDLNAELTAELMEEIEGRRVAELVAAREIGLDPFNFPHLDGSTSARPLKQLLTCRLLGVDYEWFMPDLHFMWGLQDMQTRDVRAKYYQGKEGRKGQMINAQMMGMSTGTHQAYVNLIEGRADLILVAREPSPDERELASQRGVELKIQPIARDAFVFISNFKNPVRNLTSEQLKGIYQNKITNWSEVGGPDAPINAYQRDRNSGSQELMETVFMKGEKIYRGEGREWETSMVTFSMTGPFNKLTRDTQGIGYSVYFYEHFMATNPFVAPVAVDGVMPSFATIQSGEYPYATPVFAAIRANEADPKAHALFDWLLTEEGQAVIAESGYVPMTKSEE